jgi:hypothetical protein
MLKCSNACINRDHIGILSVWHYVRWHFVPGILSFGISSVGILSGYRRIQACQFEWLWVGRV